MTSLLAVGRVLTQVLLQLVIQEHLLQLKAGFTVITYQICTIVRSLKVQVHTTLPFKGPHNLTAAKPLELLAANFDLGGAGYAYHDDDSGNSTVNDNYRRNNGDATSTPVEVEGDGTNIGYTSAEESLLYTLNVQDSGLYLIDISLSANGERSFRLELNDKNVSGSVKVPSNGSWNSWKWMCQQKVFLLN